jgi:hypothetical protein
MAIEPKRFFFTYEDIAACAGEDKSAIYQAVHKGTLDPENLASVVGYILAKSKGEELTPVGPAPLEDQRLEIEKSVGIGLVLKGSVDDRAIVDIALPEEPQFQSARTAAIQQLGLMGYVYGVHDIEGDPVAGWSQKREDVPETP